MEWNAIYEMIDPQLAVVVMVCWVIGFVLKKTPAVPDWSIVYLVTLVAVGMTVWLLGWGAQAVLQGVLAGAFAVFGNQVIKQARKGSEQ